MSRVSGSIVHIIEELSKPHAIVHSLNLKLGDCAISIRTSDSRLRDELKEYFRSFLFDDREPDIVIDSIEAVPPSFDYEFTKKTPDPGKTKVKEEYVEFDDGMLVRKRLTGMLFLFTETRHLAYGPCRQNSNQIVNFVNSRYIQWLLVRGCLLGHAAAVARGNRGVAIAGFSGMGKSTLALHMLSRGYSFVSNDRLLIEEEGSGLRMHGVPKHPRINPGTALTNTDLESVIPDADRAALGGLSESELWNLEQKYDVFVDRVFGERRFVLTGEMVGLVILNWQRDGRPAEAERVDLSERGDLLRAFRKDTGLFFYVNDRDSFDFSEEAYLHFLSRCSVIEITGGVDFDAACDACEELLVVVEGGC